MAKRTKRSGGVDFSANNIDVGGDVVGRDKIVNTYNYYGIAEPTMRKAELPPRRPFFGREDELVQIANALKPSARTWGVVIDGAGGIGKTALAIESAHRAPAADFDTKIFLSAKTRELTVSGERSRADFALTDYLSALNELAAALGQSELAKLAPKERPREVRRALENRKALLILDNLETFDKAERDRLFQFLEELPNSCKAIITSRRRDDVSAKIIRLNQLSMDAALRLIDNLAERNEALHRTSRADRQMLIETAGGNPLLITWIAGQLGRVNSQCRTIAQACELVQAAPAGNDPLDYVFGDLCQTFSANEIAVLAALLHFSEFTSTTTIAQLATLSVQTAEMTLESLSFRALLTGDAEAQRFVLLPLTAVYVRRVLPAHAVGQMPRQPTAVAQAQTQMTNAVDETAHRLMDRAEKLIKDNGYQNYAGFKVLDAEWPTIAAALPLFVQDDNSRLQVVCDALRTFLDFTGHWDDGLSLNFQAEDKAAVAHDWFNAGWRVFQAGWIHLLRQQSAEVLACATRAEAHWRAAKAGAYEQAIAIRLRGRGHQLEKNYAAALAAFQDSLIQLRSLATESADVAIALNDMAGVEQLSGDYAAAERDYLEALRIAKKNNAQSGIATYTSNLAALALTRQDWRGAEQWAREALPLAEAVGRQALIASQSQYLAKSLARQGRKAEGLPYAQRAVEIYTKLRTPYLADAQGVLRECSG